MKHPLVGCIALLLLAGSATTTMAQRDPLDKPPFKPPTVPRHPPGSHHAASANNLKQIGLAMHNYHDTNVIFPAAAIMSKDGKPLLSWRVAILPYLEEDNLYRQFKLDEAWDSAHNKKLIAKMPRIYAPVGVKPKEENTTFYQVFVGNRAAFEGTRGTRITDITDGTSNTILAVEAGTAVPWTKPDDLPYDAKKPLPKLGGLFEGNFHVLLADGSVRFVKKGIPEEVLRFLITRDGGEVIPEDPSLEEDHAHPQHGHPHHELLAALIEALRDRDAEVRKHIHTALVNLGPVAVPILVELLSKDTEMRLTAAQVLGEIGPAAQPALPELVKMLKEQDKELRRAVAQAISLIVKQPAFQPDAGPRFGEGRDLAPPVRAAPRDRVAPGPGQASVNNLKQIGIAMHNYESVYAAFPRAAITSKGGKPLLSWRVAILPYLEEDDLYRQFKLDEPWDSEHNKKLLDKMPKVYAPVGVKPTEANTTYYQVFVGNGALFGDAEGTRLASITDGTSNTILVVEAGEAVPWTKPDDLPYDPKRALPKLGGLADGSFHILLADGSVRLVKKGFAEKVLRLAITRADGLVLDFNDIPAGEIITGDSPRRPAEPPKPKPQ